MVRPGRGVIMIMPVSVCHQVSTIGQRSCPMFVWYHIHASGLIGSPTEPSSRSELRSRRDGHSVPHRMNARIAVGAVRSEEHTSELQSQSKLVCRRLLEKKKSASSATFMNR